MLKSKDQSSNGQAGRDTDRQIHMKETRKKKADQERENEMRRDLLPFLVRKKVILDSLQRILP